MRCIEGARIKARMKTVAGLGEPGGAEGWVSRRDAEARRGDEARDAVAEPAGFLTIGLTFRTLLL